MRDKEIALAFINRIGLDNLRKKETVDSIKSYLAEFEAKLDESINIASSTNFNAHSTSYGDSKGTKISNRGSKGLKFDRPSSQVPIEVQMLEHLAELRTATSDINSSCEVKSKSFLEVGKDLLMEAKRKSSWYSILDVKIEQDDLSFEGIPRIISIIIVLARLEQYINLKESTVFPLLFNNALYSFRYAFQSESSEICTIEHPEFAISYIKNAVRKYAFLFKRAMNELKADEKPYFDSFVNGYVVKGEQGTDSLVDEFSLVCREVCSTNYFSRWCKILASEVKLFVYSRLPLLMYEYNTPPSETALSLSELNDVMKDNSTMENNKAELRVYRSSFSDRVTTSVAYALLRSLTDLSATMRSISEDASFELFSDFDNNTLIPCVNLEYENDGKVKVVLNFQDECLYGFLDALLAMENHCTMKSVKQLVNEETIFEHVAPKGTLNFSVYLQDEQHSAHMIDVVIKMLNLVDERCRCLKLAESRGTYVRRVAVPIVTHFIDDVKQIWNSLDNVLESSTVSCMLVESCTFLHSFLSNYSGSSFMSETLSSLGTMLSKMISIVKQCITELIYDPLKRIHELYFDVAAQFTDKLLQISAICNPRTYEKILKHSVECTEKYLLSIVIPKKRHEYVFQNQYNVDLALENCLVILDMWKNLVEPKEYADNLAVLEDIITILGMETNELETTVEHLHLLKQNTLKLERTSSTGVYGTDDEFALDKEAFDYSLEFDSLQKLTSNDAFISSIMEDEFGILEDGEQKSGNERILENSAAYEELFLQQVQLKAAVPVLDKVWFMITFSLMP
ncbi:hypothetical protein BEWA_029120 [Theileria equi strain WA]|uniref:Uncharacterized protein n=1 Tax=Theileria equi strain WA TaxID=1537102 RepID=L0AWU5_THEEQ|nr:hypothetical protein BEWA_029120 [Theileria equi strain WA]AFZ80062.1 hypothetical protein BEWA_029120 [Theileria equi strain WA]|eukprot:XP_004829728.1 hypothetical protein BEWA_029120 [Theileria equi strain WA]